MKTATRKRTRRERILRKRRWQQRLLCSLPAKRAPKPRFDAVFGARKYRTRFGEFAAEASTGLLSKVYAILAFSVATTVGGVVLGSRLNPLWLWILVPLSIVILVAIDKPRKRKGWNVALLYSFSFVEGLMLGPIIAALVGHGMLTVVVEAGVATVVVTTTMSAIGLAVKSAPSVWRRYILSALLGLIAIMIVNLFLGGSFVSVVASSVGVGLFSLFLVYDANRIRNTPDTMVNAVVISLEIFLDILNLFLCLLNVLAEAPDADGFHGAYEESDDDD